MGKIITKLYEYDGNNEQNNYRGLDYSQYILLGDVDVDNLDDTLDSVELTLVGLPFRDEFAPSSKFIYEKWEQVINDDGSITEKMWKDWHLVVSNDTVEQPIISDDHYFNHSISFYEASVEAQKRLVDNIAVTYRLKDVSLESHPTYDIDAPAISSISNVQATGSENFGHNEGFIWENYTTGHKFVWVMPNWYQVEIDGVTKTPDWSDWNTFKLNQEIPSGQSSKTIQLPIPMLECLCGVPGGKTFAHNGYCSIDVIVQRTQIFTGQTDTIQNFRVDPSADTPKEANWERDKIVANDFADDFGEIISRFEAVATTQQSGGVNFIKWTSKVAERVSTRTNRVLSINIESGYQYKVILKRHVFHNYKGNRNDDYPAYYSRGEWVFRTAIVYNWADIKNAQSYINDNWPLTTITFNAVLQGENKSLYLNHAPTENAYNLYNKSQLVSQNTFKQKNIPVDETITSFYLEEKDKEELKNTTIVENFYNQKNLWEIQMDIGKYIHARPKIRFGSKNRFVTTWKRYGITEQSVDYSNPISIYNSRFIEEYISACSSYVTNMVQLDGLITEIVAPKSSSEDYLVYNDVAEIITEKNIIELVDLQVIRKSDGETRDLAGKGTHGESSNGYVFEESVYNILSINANDSVNKGLAIYYTLGTNKIVGLNYQLPSINTGDADTDYAIKRIIGTVFLMASTDWKNIKVNDYLFKVSYRTKDTLRSNQSRPDLRKFILSTPYDRVPQHNQFNNQTDIVVDSVKFGNNIYGKLIRTGNKIYTKLEWVDHLSQLKQSGQLYKIDGNLYYVSKVKNIYYDDHIESEVEFSKDFNRLSQIIGIPSEPRFYEISERNIIDREISLDDYIILGTYANTKKRADDYITNRGWEFIRNLLFAEAEYPKYAVTIFKNDKDKETIFGNETFKVETCHPVCAYSIENTLTLEWDMKDNFSAGDQVVPTSLSKEPTKPIDSAYNTLVPFRYADVYGRCDMVDFAIIDNYNFSNDEVMALPSNPINLSTNNDILFTSAKDSSDYDSHENGLIVLKDNRETLKFNYNLQLITDSDRFVLSAYMWQSGKQNLRIGLLNQEINKISNETISNKDFQVENIPFSIHYLSQDGETKGIIIGIKNRLIDYADSQGKTLEELMLGIKAIVIYSLNEVNDYVNSGAKYFVFGRNISDLDVSKATEDWYLRYRDKKIFQKQ